MSLDREQSSQSTRALPRLDRTQYTIAWVAALHIEADAALDVLDQRHSGRFEDVPSDEYNFIGGEINGHHVLVATLAPTYHGRPGTVAALVDRVKLYFPNIQFALLVGVAAGLSCLEKSRDIRLGDVLVCAPGWDGVAEVHYVLKRNPEAKSEVNGNPPKAPVGVRAAINQIRLQHNRPYRTRNYLDNHLQALQQRTSSLEAQKYAYPFTDDNGLFQGPDGTSHNEEAVSRPPREKEEKTRVWYGNIGSGDMLLQDSHQIDELRDQYDLIGLETEVTGLTDTIPVAIIRGVSDNGDRHGHEEWQHYAAAVAAVYAKAILCNITPAPTTLNAVHDPVSSTGLTEVAENALSSIAFPQMTHCCLSVYESYEESCNWIASLTEYQAWSNQLSGLLLISGGPGSGKSTVMARLYSTVCESSRPGVDIPIEFAFCTSGAELQRSFCGLLRSLLYQLGEKSTRARAMIRDCYQDKIKRVGQLHNGWQWQEEELRLLLEQALLTAATSHGVIVFVDALEEAEDTTADVIIRYFQNLARDARDASTRLKICISHRHSSITAVTSGTEVAVERHNSDDIGALINRRLSSTHLSPADQHQLTGFLIQRANGVFQWIRLVLSMVEKHIWNNLSLEIIQKHVDTIPCALSDMYRFILLEVIDRKDIRRSLHLFQWTCLTSTPMSVEELRYALALGDTEAQSFHLLKSRSSDAQSFIKTDEGLKAQVELLSGGLLEVRDDKVQVIHPTVQRYIVEEGLAILRVTCANPNQDTAQTWRGVADESSPTEAVQLSYGELYWWCLQYVAAEAPTIDLVLGKREYRAPWRRGQDESNRIEALRDLEVLRVSPLIRHAVTNLLVYAQKAGKFRPHSPSEQLESLEAIVNLWITLNRNLAPWTGGWYPRDGMTSLHLAVHMNLYDLAACKLGQSDAAVDAQDAEGYTALHIAVDRGYRELVELLCDHAADVTKETGDEKTCLAIAAANGNLPLVKFFLSLPLVREDSTRSKGVALIAACQAGDEQIVLALLEAGAEVDSPGTHIGHDSPLQAASAENHCDIVRLLLEHKADINLQRGYGGCALQMASAFEHLDVVRLLIDMSADVNLISGTSDSALTAASFAGRVDIARVLLESGADVNQEYGEKGSALVSASTNGHLEVVQLLLEHGADIDSARGYLGCALAAASSADPPHLAVIRLLLQREADVNSVGGDCGSALHTASARGHVEVIETLVQHGANVNLEAKDAGSPLQAALCLQQIEAAALLLAHGAKLNLGTGDHGTALQAACTGGSAELVEALIEMGADVNQQAGKYGNAVQTAARHGQIEVLRTLVRLGADINQQGGKYGTALQAACEWGLFEMTQTILESGADVNAGGGQYGSALEAALKTNDNLIVELLVSKGARA